MRKIIGAVFMSLDGVIQAPGGSEEDPTGGFRLGGWLAPYLDESDRRADRCLFAEPFDLLLGRRTYDIFAAFGRSSRVRTAGSAAIRSRREICA